MRKIVFKSISLIILVISLFGCEQNSKNEDDSINNDKVVRLASASTQDFMGELSGIAQEKKYFDEELEKIGYKIKYVNFPAAGPAINEAFVGESIDFANYGDLPPVVLKSKGIDISTIAITNSQYNMDLIVQNNSNINSVEDIKGKKIIVGKGTIYQQYFGRLMKEHALNENDIEVVNAVADAQSTFLSKSADGYIVADAQARILVNQGDARIVESTMNKPEFSSQLVLIGRNKYMKNNPDVPVALLKALIRAQDFARSNEEESYKILANSGISEDIIKESYGYDNGKFEYFGLSINEDSVKKLNELNNFLYEKKLIDKKVDINSFVDNSYYEKALKELEK